MPYTEADNLCSCGHTLHFGKCHSCDCEITYKGEIGFKHE